MSSLIHHRSERLGSHASVDSPISSTPHTSPARLSPQSASSLSSGSPPRASSSSNTSTLVTIPALDGRENQTGAVIARIESILDSVLGGLLGCDKVVSVPYRARMVKQAHRSRVSNTLARIQADEHQAAPDEPLRRNAQLRFPGRTIQEARKFCAVLHILKLSHAALVSKTVITKRNIYYQNTELFREQRAVDNLVDDIAFTLGVTRDALNIVAAAKSLVSGPVSLVMHDGSTISCAQARESGTLIPHISQIHKINFGSTQWVLVIEKEATFRTLSASEYFNKSLAGKGIIMTAKGVPCLAIRSFLHTIHRIRPQLPIYALVDYDPYGIRILRTYKYGSRSLDHERHVTVPSMLWLGIRSRDIFRMESLTTEQLTSQTSTIPQNLSQTSSSQDSLTFSSEGSQQLVSRLAVPRMVNSHNEGAWMPLTRQDRKRAAEVLSEVVSHADLDVDELEHQRELQLMLILNVKAEMQAVDQSGDMTDWLDHRLGLRGAC